MDAGGCYGQGDIIIKQEPENDEDYGAMSQDYPEAPEGDSHSHDCLVMSKAYSQEGPEGDSYNHDDRAMSPGYSQEGSEGDSEEHDYKVMSRRYAREDSVEDDNELLSRCYIQTGTNRTQNESYHFENEGIGRYSIVKTEYSPSDSEDASTDTESSPRITTGEAEPETVRHPLVKEESVDDSYDVAYNHSNVHIKGEVFSSEESQQDANEEEIEEDENETESERVFERTRRGRKVKRNPSFEYENDSPCSQEEDLGQETQGASTEFEIYMDREEEHEQGMGDTSVQPQDLGTPCDREDRVPCDKEDRVPCDKEDNSKMIARYALYDVENSEMVGIKSVNPKMCEICNKEFQYEFHKKFHMQKVHPETLEKDKRKNGREEEARNKGTKGKFNPRARYSKTCFICRNKIYTHPYYLNLHMQEVHPEWLIDNKMIQNLTAVDEADSTQAGNKKKVCPVCYEGFRFAYQLKYHIQKAHAEILVEDKRVDTSKLPSREESEIAVDDQASRFVKPVVSTNPLGGIKLTYTVQDILNIKRNMEKETAAKEAKEAQRLAKCLEPRKRLGRPPKAPGSRGPGRPRKVSQEVKSLPETRSDTVYSSEENIQEMKAPASEDVCMHIKEELPEKDDDDDDDDTVYSSEENIHEMKAPASEDVCMHIKEELPEKDDDDDDDDDDQMSVNVRIDEDSQTGNSVTSDKYLSICKTNFEKETNLETLPADAQSGIYACSQSLTLKTEGGREMGLSEAGCPQVKFRLCKEQANSAGNTPLEFRSDVGDSTSSGVTISDHYVSEAKQECKKEETECVSAHTHNTRPKRKRKKRELKDMLPLTPVKRRKWKAKTDPTSTQEEKKSKSDKRSAKNSKGTIPVGSAHIYCGQCGRIFVSPQTFQQHEALCLTLEAPVPHAGYYPCYKCQSVFQHVAAQQLHMLRDHPDISHTCPFCGKVFAYQSVMKKHLYTHTNEAVKKAISALKEDPSNKATAAGQGSKLVDLISNLGVEGDTESDSLENKTGGLEVSVPLNNLKKGLAILKSLPEVLGPSGSTKDETLPPSHLTVTSEVRIASPRRINMQESCTDISKSVTPPGSEASDGAFHALKHALGHYQRSKSPSTITPSSSVSPSSSVTLSSVTPSSAVTPSTITPSSSATHSSPVTPSSAPPTTSTSPPAKTYFCKKCNGIFPSLPLLYKHEMESHLDFICRYCSKGFVYENMLRKHLAVHRDTDKHVCMWCGRRFSYITGLKNHTLTHNGNQESHKLVCNKCGKCWYDTDGYLPQASKQLIGDHLQECFQTVDIDDLLKTYATFGAKNKLQRCLECDKSYDLNNEHSRNVKMAHVFRCKVCHFEFQKLLDLKNHVFEHHREAREYFKVYKEDQIFNCGLCSEHFSYLFEFMCHMADHKKDNLEERNV